LDFGGVGVWDGFVDVFSHFVDNRLSFVTSIRKCQCDDCWWCFRVGVSGFIVGAGLIAGVGGINVRVCSFLFTFDDVGDDSFRVVIVDGEYCFKVV